MISKKKLRERLLDLANGAGVVWYEEYGYFDYEGSALECAGSLIDAVERAFDLTDDTRMREPSCLKYFEDIKTMTDLVYDVIEFDSHD